MSLIIDGYNLLHASGILARGVGPGVLERARGALLNFLAESLTAAEIERTIVVFDAAQAPKGLERIVNHRGILVRFASPEGEADEVIEQLIRECSAPRKLVVVSSDHRLHRAARRRRATPIDSDRWHSQIVQRRLAGATPVPVERPTADQPLSEAETAFWLAAFDEQPVKPVGDARVPRLPNSSNQTSPFPPGYGEEITEDDVD